jgi:ubiquinone/menaquinone biosynthesis C-methylase UbiE
MMRSFASSASVADEQIDPQFPERVCNLFNQRAEDWNRKYLSKGKLRWRLNAFCGPLRQSVDPPTEVLDFGCGTGHLAAHLRGHGYRVTGCDFAENMIFQAQRNFGAKTINWVRLAAGWRRLPFADSVFGAVVASSVFEYLANVDLVLRELARVLKDQGVLIFNVPNPESFRRRRELWSLRLTKQGWTRSAVCIIPRARRYFTYLDLSTNRYALQEWESRAEMHGFQRVQRLDQQQYTRPMFMFAFRKSILVSRGSAFTFLPRR